MYNSDPYGNTFRGVRDNSDVGVAYGNTHKDFWDEVKYHETSHIVPNQAREIAKIPVRARGELD